VGAFGLLWAARASGNPGQGVPFAQLEAQVTALTARVQSLEATVAALQGHLAITASDPASPALTVRAAPGQTANLTEWLDANGNVVASLSASGDVDFHGSVRFGSGSCKLTEPVAGQCDIASNAGSTQLTVAGQAVPMEALKFLSASGTDVTLGGANLHVVNGTGSETSVNGLGNLIVGYNPLRGSGDDRSGSHNVVVGADNNYSSHGGIVAGFYNTVSGPYATATGGQQNTASGPAASVSGGTGNLASGYGASVSGGTVGTASNFYSSVSGGAGATASGPRSWAAGGNGNSATGDDASVCGGYVNTASGAFSTVSGGNSVTESASTGWSVGGTFHIP
jgi:hypothetical protein